MTNEHDERALIALLAKGLIPEAQDPLTDEEIAGLLAEDPKLPVEEKRALASMDPLAFRKKSGERGRVIQFPGPAEELPYAVGYNRQSEDDANEAVLKKRKEIVEKLKRQSDQKNNNMGEE